MKTEELPVWLPKEFAGRMEALLAEEYQAFMQSYGAKRVYGLRLNALKGETDTWYRQNRDKFGLRPVPWCEEGFYYDPQTRPGLHPFHEAGVYYIQEPSAMAVVSLLDPQPGDYVLDLCAAPGGKSSHIASRLAGEGLLVSNEIHPARAKILSRNMERMGVCNAVVMNEDPGRLADVFGGFFDKIVVDAPCSGEGMFRKDAEAGKEWSLENVALCAARQQEILENAARMLRPGGQLVYSTCTFSPEENESQIARFLETHPMFSVVGQKGRRLPGLSAGRVEWCREDCPQVADTYRIWPHLSEGEGHFLALLEMREEGGREERAQQKEKRKGQRSWKDREGIKLLRECLKEIICQEELDRAKKAGEALGVPRLAAFGEQIYQVPKGMPDLDKLRVVRPGLHLGTLQKNRFEPSHALALALAARQANRTLCLEADGEEIREYLAGGTVSAREAGKGWILVCAGGYPLGWGKQAGDVVKNHYPKGLRIQPGSSKPSKLP
ncbi:RNA methyltransferase [Clostridiaceae bacterium]|nr:RNA methyltransferase [Clostridiaceae bacterium]RKI13598.1 RNA methyltransferase [bacterium 1XD21-70]